MEQKMSEASLDKIQSLLDNRKEDIDDRHAAQAIERDLFGHMAREVAGGLKVISREQMKAVARLARQEKETATPTENQSIVSPDTGFDENAPEAYEQSGDMDEPGEERGEGDEVLEESEMLFRRAFSEDQMNNHHETITAIPKQPTEATSDARRKLYERIRIKMQASSISMRENAKLLDPMHYKVLDLTGHHIRTKKALGQLYSLARQDYASQILYTRSTLKQHEQDVFDDLDRACTEEQKRIRRMLEIW
ncbi:hypothetical protein BX666DRAFT_1660006 [Dichotomocladium elegans]|nr:hypothetical protein BX666DRAFT_1660006 [Dichotomocladium elegans]